MGQQTLDNIMPNIFRQFPKLLHVRKKNLVFFPMHVLKKPPRYWSMLLSLGVILGLGQSIGNHGWVKWRAPTNWQKEASN
jgi:hypothetical protein